MAPKYGIQNSLHLTIQHFRPFWGQFPDNRPERKYHAKPRVFLLQKVFPLQIDLKTNSSSSIHKLISRSINSLAIVFTVDEIHRYFINDKKLNSYFDNLFQELLGDIIMYGFLNQVILFSN